jgi:ribonuclease HI
MTFYAVRNGLLPGIYDSWQKTSMQVLGYKGAIYKKFDSKREAETFLTEHTSTSTKPSITTSAKPSITTDITTKIKVNIKPKFPINAYASELNMACQTYFQHRDYLISNNIAVAYTDGSAINNGFINARAGYGIFFANPKLGNVSESLIRGKLSNNVAELQAIRNAIEILMDKITPEIQSMEIHTDSQYAIGVITGTKNAKANKELIMTIRNLISVVPFTVNFNYIEAHTNKNTIHHIGNKIADLLAGQASAPKFICNEFIK